MRLLAAAVIVLVLSFVPLLLVGLNDPAANPIGLGLLSVGGTIVAIVLVLIAAIGWVWNRIR